MDQNHGQNHKNDKSVKWETHSTHDKALT